MTIAPQVLEEELHVYEGLKADLLAIHEGKYVLIKGDKIIGLYADWESAYAEGQRRFGLAEPMLIQLIAREDPVHILPVALWPVDGDL